MDSSELELAGSPDLAQGGAQPDRQKAQADPSPGKAGRWILAGALVSAYLPMQLVIALIGLIIWGTVLGATGQTDIIEQWMTNPEAVQTSDGMLWLTLIAAAFAAIVTLALVAIWPALWEFFTSRRINLSEWVAWRPPRRLPLWVVPILTLGVVVGVGLVVSQQFGPTEVEIQMQLFNTPGLQIIAAVVVSTIVPLAEELVFRGAVYEALLPESGGWQRHGVPFAVTTLLFAAVHLLAGFESTGSLIVILLLSAYLTTLRTLTGSVQASVVAHLVWNATAALGLLLGPNLPV